MGRFALWNVSIEDILSRQEDSDKNGNKGSVGKLFGKYETGNRITCLRAFQMIQNEDDEAFSESEGLEEDEEDSDADSDQDSESG